MKKIFVIAVFSISVLLSCIALAQLKVNTHISTVATLKDSAGNATWSFKAARTVTSDKINIQNYPWLSLQLSFAATGANYDSTAFSVYGKVSNDGTDFYQCAGCSTRAVVTSWNPDSAYILQWTFPVVGMYFKWSIKGYAANDSASGGTITATTTRAQ